MLTTTIEALLFGPEGWNVTASNVMPFRQTTKALSVGVTAFCLFEVRIKATVQRDAWLMSAAVNRGQLRRSADPSHTATHRLTEIKSADSRTSTDVLTTDTQRLTDTRQLKAFLLFRH